MRRRALLASLATLSAGCLGSESGPNSGDATTRFGTTSATPTSRTTADSTTTSSPTSTESTSSRDATDAGGNPEFSISGLDVSTRTDGPSVKHVLEPWAFYSKDAVEREETETGEEQVVMAVSDIESPAVREAVEIAIEEREWRSNELPEGLADLLERVDFFTGVTADPHTHVGLTLHRLDPDAPPAIEFDASVVDSVVAPGDPGVVKLALTNVSSAPRQVFSGTVPPFGIVFAESVARDDRFLLWRPYEEEGCVYFQDDGSYAVCAIGKETELAPGQTVAREYAILPGTSDNQPQLTVPPGPGTYRISDSVSHYDESGPPETKLSFEVEFALESV